MPGSKPEFIALAAEQLRIMSPLVFVGGIIGIMYGLLNVVNSFFWPSFSPAAMSIAMLAALTILPPDDSGRILAWATLGGGIFQLLAQLPDYWKNHFSIKPVWEPKLPELKQIGELLFPAFIGTTIGQLNVFVDMFFASGLQEGGWTAVIMSNRLLQLPIGVLQTALLVPIFPMFSRFVADQNWDRLKSYFKGGVVSLWFISIPMLIIMLLYTQDIIRLIFQHGSFDTNDTNLVSLALIFQAFQMIPYFARDSLTRVFYAFGDARTPLMIGVLAIFTKAVLDWILIKPFGIGGITFSTTLVTLINMILLGWLSKKHIADLGFKEMTTPFLKLCSAGLFMAAIILLAQQALQAIPFEDHFTDYGVSLIRIVCATTAGLFTYTVSALAMRVTEAQYLFEKLSVGFFKLKSKIR